MVVAGVRREEREETVRVVEYSSFPRMAPEPALQMGFTRDISRSGMCLGVDRREDVGTLLRLSVRDVEGRPAEARIGRVVWTSSERDGRHWLGVKLVTAPPSRLAAAPARRAVARDPLRLLRA
jgi:hypothetical protein